MHSPWPDFYIVGAPKSGTTSLREYLRRHPSVFFPQGREPVFFGADLQHRWRIHDQDDYLALYRDKDPELLAGDKQVWCLYSSSAAAEIAAVRPDARILMILRDPAELIASLHGQFLRTKNESEADLERALALATTRRNGQHIPRTSYFPRGLQYFDIVSFSSQIQRFFDYFSKDQVLILKFDDMKNSPSNVFSCVCQFLQIDHQVKVPFDVHNLGTRPRSSTASSLVEGNMPLFEGLPARLREALRWRLRQWNRLPASGKEKACIVRAYFASDLIAEIRALEELTALEFGAWAWKSWT